MRLCANDQEHAENGAYDDPGEPFLLEVLDALKAADVGDRVRQQARNLMLESGAELPAGPAGVAPFAERDPTLPVRRIRCRSTYDRWRCCCATPSTAKTPPAPAPDPAPRSWLVERALAVGALRLVGRHDITEATGWTARYIDQPFTIPGPAM